MNFAKFLGDISVVNKWGAVQVANVHLRIYKKVGKNLENFFLRKVREGYIIEPIEHEHRPLTSKYRYKSKTEYRRCYRASTLESAIMALKNTDIFDEIVNMNEFIEVNMDNKNLNHKEEKLRLKELLMPIAKQS